MAIKCYDGNNKPLTHLTQWDRNQKVIIHNVNSPAIPMVYISNLPCGELTPCDSSYTGTTLTLNIPNILLEEPLPLNIYVNLDDFNNLATALYTIRIPVVPREEPEYIHL